MPFPQTIAFALPSFQTIGGLALLASAVYVIVRSKAASVLRDERDAYQQKSERLQEELTIGKEALTACKEESHAKDIVITDLQAKTDMTKITEAQLAILANQTQGKALAVEINNALSQIATAMKAMEKRLDQGLVMK